MKKKIKIPYTATQGVSDRLKKLIRNYRGILPNGYNIYVLKGFKYDGASIPKFLWSIIGSPFTGKYQRAAFIHDVLYAGEVYHRKLCDLIFLQIMKEHKVFFLKRYIIWLGVRLGGCWVWRKHKKEEVEKVRTMIKLNRIL